MPVRPKFSVPDKRTPIFVDRQDEMKHLHKTLQTEKNVLLWGMGGIGKTQLVNQYAFRFASKYPGGVYWVDAFKDWQAELARLAKVVGIRSRHPSDPESPGKLAIAFVNFINQHPNALIIFDNVEDPLLLSVPVIENIHVTELSCRLLVTTRRHDPSIPFTTIGLGLLPNDDALELLLVSAKRKRLSDEESDAAREICHSLGNHPLALQLASSHLRKYKTVTFWGYLQDLQTKGIIKTVDPRRAVTTALEVQWDTLKDETARRILKTAALLCGPEAYLARTRLALFANLSDKPKRSEPSPLEKALVSLYELSLLEGFNTQEVRLHPLVCEFTRQEPLNENEYLTLLAGLRTVMNGKQLEAFRRRAASLLTRLEWFDAIPITEISPTEILNYLELVVRYFDTRQQHLYLLERGIKPMLNSDSVDLQIRERALLHMFSAALQARSGVLDDGRMDEARLTAAQKDYQKARSLVQELIKSGELLHEDYKLDARINLGFANVVRTLARKHQSQEGYSDALRLYKAAAKAAQAYGQDPILAATIFKEMSFTYSISKKWAEAELSYKNAIEVLREYVRYYTQVLETASHLHEERGKSLKTISRAITEFRAAYQLTEEEIATLDRAVGDSNDLANAHMNAAEYLLKIVELSPSPLPHQIETACEHWRAAILIAQRLGIEDIEVEAQELLEQNCPDE